MEIYHNDAVKVWQISEETICLVLSHYLLAAFSLRDSQGKLQFKKIYSITSPLAWLIIYSHKQFLNRNMSLKCKVCTPINGNLYTILANVLHALIPFKGSILTPLICILGYACTLKLLLNKLFFELKTLFSIFS